jgi:hypothetical protein
MFFGFVVASKNDTKSAAKPIDRPYIGFVAKIVTGKMRNTHTLNTLMCSPPAIGYQGERMDQKRFQATVFSAVTATNPSTIITATADDFVVYLATLSRQSAPSKESLYLFSPACFKPDTIQAREKGKTKDNIDYCNGIWLDADACPLSPEEVLMRSLPNTRAICYATYNSTVAAPRFRCFIPTHQTLSVEQYDVIAHEIVDRIGLVDHGFDISKLNAAALFYRPCMPMEPAASYFQDLPGDSLDVAEWIETASDENILRYGGDDDLEPDGAQITSTDLTANPETVERALRAWRNANHQDHHDNENFFLLGCRLKQAGCSNGVIGRILEVEVWFANSPQDRLAQIPGIIAWLNRNARAWNDG